MVYSLGNSKVKEMLFVAEFKVSIIYWGRALLRSMDPKGCHLYSAQIHSMLGENANFVYSLWSAIISILSIVMIARGGPKISDRAEHATTLHNNRNVNIIDFELEIWNQSARDSHGWSITYLSLQTRNQWETRVYFSESSSLCFLSPEEVGVPQKLGLYLYFLLQ